MIWLEMRSYFGAEMMRMCEMSNQGGRQVIRSCERKRRGITDSTLTDKICPYVQLGNRGQENQQQKIIINITETSLRFIPYSP